MDDSYSQKKQIDRKYIKKLEVSFMHVNKLNFTHTQTILIGLVNLIKYVAFVVHLCETGLLFW